VSSFFALLPFHLLADSPDTMDDSPHGWFTSWLVHPMALLALTLADLLPLYNSC